MLRIDLSLHAAGALLGALTIAALGRFQWKGRLLTIGTFLFPLTLIFFGLVTWLPLSLAVLAATGWEFLILANMAGTLLQTLVPEALRGRVTGFYSLVAFGSLPIGALAAGALADKVGLPLTVILGAACMLFISLAIYIFVPQLRKAE